MEARIPTIDGSAMTGAMLEHAAETRPAAEAFDAALLREYPRIRRLARRFGIQEADLDDAAQDVLATAWIKRDTFENRAGLATWVTRIALNHFATALKRQRRRSAFDLSGIWQDRRVITPRAASQDKESYDLATRCVGALSRKLREAFVLRYLEDMPYAEVAEVLGISEGAARARAFEARVKLREMLREYDL